MPNWWATSLYEAYGIGMVLTWAFWVIGSVVLHELAHGFTAIRSGDRTPIDTGHMTWNPVVHMGISGVVMFALLGVTWGFMPVDPSRFKGRHADAKVAFAGPVTNLWLGLLAIVGASIVVALDQRGVIDITASEWAGNLQIFFMFGGVVNLALFALNMLPVPPLDGSRILSSYAGWYRDLTMHPQASVVSMLAMIFLFFYGGRYFFDAAFWGAAELREILSTLFAGG